MRPGQYQSRKYTERKRQTSSPLAGRLSEYNSEKLLDHGVTEKMFPVSGDCICEKKIFGEIHKYSYVGMCASSALGLLKTALEFLMRHTLSVELLMVIRNHRVLWKDGFDAWDVLPVWYSVEELRIVQSLLRCF